MPEDQYDSESVTGPVTDPPAGLGQSWAKHHDHDFKDRAEREEEEEEEFIREGGCLGWVLVIGAPVCQWREPILSACPLFCSIF